MVFRRATNRAMKGPRFGGVGAVRAPVREGERVALAEDLELAGLLERLPAARDERRALALDAELPDRDDFDCDDVGVLVPMVGEPNRKSA